MTDSMTTCGPDDPGMRAMAAAIELATRLKRRTDVQVTVVKHAWTLNSRRHAEQLADRLDELGNDTVVVVGSGLTGTESGRRNRRTASGTGRGAAGPR